MNGQVENIMPLSYLPVRHAAGIKTAFCC